MKIVHIEHEKRVKKTKKELQQEFDACKNDMEKMLINDYKLVPSDESTYFVSMSEKEFQLVSFYLELEQRQPIINVEIGKSTK